MVKNFGKYQNYVGGEFVSDGREKEVISPVDGSKIAKVIMANEDVTRRAIDEANDAFYSKWLKTTLLERKALLEKLSNIVQEKSELYAQLESANTGKTIRQSTLMDIPLAIDHLRYFAHETEFKESREITHPEYPGTNGIIQYAPLGVIGAIVPWNVPIMMTVWKLAPAIVAGNTIVIKSSQFTPLTALELARDVDRAGFPHGTVNIIAGEGSTIGDIIARSPKVNAVSFTGSTATGKKVLNAASSGIKKVTLELGGKSPNIVFDDADLETAVKGSLFGIFLNSGQLCESGSRLIVQKSIKSKFLEMMEDKISKMNPGNPMQFETDLSAITTADQLGKIREMVSQGETEGVKVIQPLAIEGRVPSMGFYYPPTILAGIEGRQTIAMEEIFGPVVSVQEFETEEEAVNIANDTRYGLASAVWTNDNKRAMRVGSRIEAGTVWVNDYHLLSAAAPRGGFKDSGIGRELGLEGILEYTQTRHIFLSNTENALKEIAYGLLLP
jgi:acyl-CoA reductase-like NAD-dependent aldehyde dehydrogenase